MKCSLLTWGRDQADAERFYLVQEKCASEVVADFEMGMPESRLVLAEAVRNTKLGLHPEMTHVPYPSFLDKLNCLAVCKSPDL